MAKKSNGPDRLHVDLKFFEDFYAALANSLQKSINETRMSRASNSTTGKEMYFQQPRYGSRSRNFSQRNNSNHRHDQQRPQRKFQPRSYFRPSFKRANESLQTTPGAPCFTCGQAGHIWQRCRNPKEFIRIGTGMDTWFERKKSRNGAKRVLFQFAEALDVL